MSSSPLSWPSSTSTTTSPVPSVVGLHPVFAQVMLRINSPAASSAFYGDLLGMSLLTRLDFPAFKFSLFFYAYSTTTPPMMSMKQSSRAEWLWARPEPTVELTWNWPADTLEESLALAYNANNSAPPSEEIYVSGNDNPKGFIGLEIVVDDVQKAMKMLAEKKVSAVMNNTAKTDGMESATVSDPDGYHVRLVQRADAPTRADAENVYGLDPVFSGVAVRVKDPRIAVPFFERLGFKLVSKTDDHQTNTSDFVLAYYNEEIIIDDENESKNWLSKLRAPSIVLRHIWGSEESEEQMYTNGNVKPYRGFGHVGIVIDDIYQAMDSLEELGYKVVRKPGPFADVGELAFIAEPSTEYWVEIIKRAGTPAEEAYEQPAMVS